MATVTEIERRHDSISRPAHYQTRAGLEAIDVIEAFDFGYHLGNVVKYLCRAGRKPGVDVLEDLEKAAWYLRRAIDQERAARARRPGA